MKKKTQFVMVGIGEILWDMLPDGKQLGGAPANFSFHAGQLGNSSVVVSCIGRDASGQEIISTLDNKNINHLITFSDQYSTGYVTVMMNKEGKPSYTIHENVAWDHLKIDTEHITLAKTVDVVCFGTLAQRNIVSSKAIQQFISHTPKKCIKILDINFRQTYYSKKSIATLLDLANVLKLNDEELLVVARLFGLSGQETTLLDQLQKTHALDLIILTKGARGSRLFAECSQDSEFKGYPVEVVDTVGAGDSFTAAVATGLCRGMSLEKIHPIAARVAALVCEHPGATPLLPHLEKLFK